MVSTSPTRKSHNKLTLALAFRCEYSNYKLNKIKDILHKIMLEPMLFTKSFGRN